MPDQTTITRSDGVVLHLPDIAVTTSLSCTHTVSIDGNAMEITAAVRYLLADRERIITELADLRAKKQVEET